MRVTVTPSEGRVKTRKQRTLGQTYAQGESLGSCESGLGPTLAS